MSETPHTPETGDMESKPSSELVTPAANAAASAEAHADHHHEPNVKTYLIIFGALSGFTLVSFVFNTLANAGTITHTTSFIAIMSVAVVKALLVATWFMHLIVDWGKLFVLIIPALILGPLLMIVLLPDIVLAWWNVTMP